MATDNGTETVTSTTTPTGETQGQEQQGQQQGTTEETSGQGQQQTPAAENKDEKPVKLPDDHPLVKTLATQKTELAAARTELTELRAKSAKVTKLEEDLAKRPTTEAVETLQKRTDRLEAFLSAVGGPLGKALDSKTFSTRLFETEDKIDDIVKDWNKANPSTTATALGAAAAQPTSTGPSINELLRKAK